MKLIDSKGRLFGKVNILDLGAIAVIVLVLIGIFVVPSPTGTPAQVVSSPSDDIQISLLVRGLTVKNAPQFLQSLQDSDVEVIIRNEAAGKLKIQSVTELPNYTVANQPDGTVKAVLDPRPIVAYLADMILDMSGKGTMTDDGAVIANQKVKVGTALELNSSTYNFRGSVIDVQKTN